MSNNTPIYTLLFPQEIVHTHFFYVLFLPSTCSFFSSDRLRCKSNFKYLLSSRLDFVFKSLEKKKNLLISPMSFFLFYLLQKNSSSCCVALLHPALFSSTSTLPFIRIFLSIRELEFGVVYTAGQRRELVLPMLLAD